MATADHIRAQSIQAYGPSRRYDAVIVGGGPAGLTAALGLASAGASVAVVDEASELGGQYYKRRRGAVLSRHGDHRPAGTRLIAEAREVGVDCLTSRMVWGVGDDGRTLLTTSTVEPDHVALSADAIIVSTGAYERSVPFPGWQLPGVVTPGYALHLATTDVVPIGRRVLVGGTGPFLLPVACALLEVGCEVVSVVELNRPYRPSRHVVGSLRHPGRIRELAGYMGTLARHKVPIRQGWTVAAAMGQHSVQSVRLEPSPGQPPASAIEVDVDALAVGYGFRPSTELVQLLGAACRVDPASGEMLPECDDHGRTSVHGVYVAGEVAGIAGVHAARIRGWLAAVAAAEQLGFSRPGASETSRALRQAARLDQFAQITGRLYPVPASLTADLPDDTVICRCEAVTAGRIRAAAALGWNDRSAVKGVTRAGMGPCQGRECSPSVASLFESVTGATATCPTARAPIKPIPVVAAMGVFAQEDLS